MRYSSAAEADRTPFELAAARSLVAEAVHNLAEVFDHILVVHTADVAAADTPVEGAGHNYFAEEDIAAVHNHQERHMILMVVVVRHRFGLQGDVRSTHL